MLICFAVQQPVRSSIKRLRNVSDDALRNDVSKAFGVALPVDAIVEECVLCGGLDPSVICLVRIPSQSIDGFTSLIAKLPESHDIDYVMSELRCTGWKKTLKNNVALLRRIDIFTYVLIENHTSVDARVFLLTAVGGPFRRGEVLLHYFESIRPVPQIDRAENEPVLSQVRYANEA